MRIIIKMNDGSVAIMNPGDILEFIEKFPEQLDTIIQGEINGWALETQQKIVSWRIFPEEAILPDRTFRNAWSDVTAALDIDMTKAKEIWKNKIRKARKSTLEALDVEYMKALEIEDKALQAEIILKKNALRDITDDPILNNAQTPEDLKAFWPEIIKPEIQESVNEINR